MESGMMTNEADRGDGRVWVVVQTKKGQERRAAREIKAEGFEIYLPMKICKRVRFGKEEVLPMPFLPSYMFARVSLQLDEWRTIFRLEGVFTILGGTRPYGVQDWVIRRIKLAEENGYIPMGLHREGGEVPQDLVERKTKVLVDKGTCDIEGLFLERVDANRALILVSLLQRDSRITVDLRKVKAQAT
jgi:transcription antitermination factor NusG